MSSAALPTSRLIAILRGLLPGEASGVGRCLYQAGIRTLEVPLNSPEPLVSIDRLRSSLPADVLVGAGTVLEPGQVADCQAAGAQFIVSPDLNDAVVTETMRRGLGSFPGVATPTEAFRAARLGTLTVKIFPAEQVGIAGMRAWLAVLPPDLALYPVGGVQAGNLAEWLNAGATGVGIGSSLFRPGVSLPALAERAADLVSAWSAAQDARSQRAAADVPVAITAAQPAQ
jgi:2-dehydro-3-deoxyphosphogalactonate aldolase